MLDNSSVDGLFPPNMPPPHMPPPPPSFRDSDDETMATFSQTQADLESYMDYPPMPPPSSTVFIDQPPQPPSIISTATGTLFTEGDCFFVCTFRSLCTCPLFTGNDNVSFEQRHTYQFHNRMALPFRLFEQQHRMMIL